MAASIKISELNSLDNLTDVDLFLVSDMESTTSKKITYANLKSNLVDNLATAVSDLTEVVSQNNTTVTASIDSVNQSLTISLGELADATQADIDAYEALQDDMNLGLMLAYNDSPVFIDTLFGG